MNLERLAQDQLARSEARLRDADRAFHEERWADTIRGSQEAVELALKSLLRAVAVEVPKRHDVGPVLEAVASALPADIRRQLSQVVELSADLAARRALAMYGDEESGRPASDLFDSREEAHRYLTRSHHLVALVRRHVPAGQGGRVRKGSAPASLRRA